MDMKVRAISQTQLSEKKKGQYACRLFRTNSLMEGVMWHTDALLGKDLETNNETTVIARQQTACQWTGWVAIM
jgi:hypothetical protein